MAMPPGRGPVTIVGHAMWMLLLAMVVATPASGQVEHEFDPEADPEQPWAAEPEPDADSPEGRILRIRRLLAEDEGRAARREANRWLEDFPDHERLPEVRVLRGDARVASGRYYRAMFDYEHVAGNYPGTEQFHIALERQYELASRFLRGLKRRLGPFRILPVRSESEEALIRIQQRAPGSEIGERAMFTLAEYYHDRGRMALAAEAYDLFLMNYPRSRKRPVAMERLIEVSVARYKGPEYDSSGLIEAQERLAAYKAEYPAAAERFGAEGLEMRIDESLGEQAYQQARWFERRGEDVSAAYLYRRLIREHPGTAVSRRALERLEALDEPIPDPPEPPEAPDPPDPQEPAPPAPPEAQHAPEDDEAPGPPDRPVPAQPSAPADSPLLPEGEQRLQPPPPQADPAEERDAD